MDLGPSTPAETGPSGAPQSEEEFRRFVAARMDMLRGLAYLTCGDWQAAEDAVARCLAKLYTRWGKVGAPERYAARMVVRAAIDEVRRPWRREVPASHGLPEVEGPDPAESVGESMHIRAALRQVPPGQRAVLVLRYFADFSVEETAEALGRSTGTVKSQTARGLATLRLLLAAHDITLAEDLEEGTRDDRYARTAGDR
jgi:RNA polymerase sigma-70 factor (sigma-E family)